MHERQGNFQAEIGKVSYIGDLKVEAYKPTLPQTNVSNTSNHEAIHAVVAEANGTSVKKVTRIPGPGYLGMTELSRFDPVAAIAPHSDGCDGTSFDVSLVEMTNNVVFLTEIRAQNIINNRRDQIHRVAQKLDEKGTLSGGEVRSVMREMEEGEDVIINITDKLGASQQLTAKTKKPLVVIQPAQLALAG